VHMMVSNSSSVGLKPNIQKRHTGIVASTIAMPKAAQMSPFLTASVTVRVHAVRLRSPAGPL
jgi:hypothetical protein